MEHAVPGACSCRASSSTAASGTRTTSAACPWASRRWPPTPSRAPSATWVCAMWRSTLPASSWGRATGCMLTRMACWCPRWASSNCNCIWHQGLITAQSEAFWMGLCPLPLLLAVVRAGGARRPEKRTGSRGLAAVAVAGRARERRSHSLHRVRSEQRSLLLGTCRGADLAVNHQPCDPPPRGLSHDGTRGPVVRDRCGCR